MLLIHHTMRITRKMRISLPESVTVANYAFSSILFILNLIKYIEGLTPRARATPTSNSGDDRHINERSTEDPEKLSFCWASLPGHCD